MGIYRHKLPWMGVFYKLRFQPEIKNLFPDLFLQYDLRRYFFLPRHVEFLSVSRFSQLTLLYCLTKAPATKTPETQ